MPRLFVGTFLSKPDQQRLAPLPDFNSHLEELWQRKVHWVKPEKLHITWLFLGDIEDHLVSKVGAALQKSIVERKRRLREEAEKPLNMHFDRPEIWPTTRKPRTLVVESRPVETAITSFARNIRNGLIPFWTEQTEKEHNQDFRPHVTLLRMDRRIEIPGERKQFGEVPTKVETNEVNKLQDMLPFSIDIDSVCLVQSKLDNGEYRILAELPIH